MLDGLFQRPHAVARQLNGPLPDERLRYLTHCAGEGMARRTLRLTADYLLQVAAYLHLADRPEARIRPGEIKRAAARWARRRPAPRTVKGARLAERRFIRRATGWLTFLGRLARPAPPPHPQERQITAFAAFMADERGLSPQTIRARSYTLRGFLTRLCGRDKSLRDVTAADVDRALAGLVRDRGWARVSARTCAASLRAFFRYAEGRGWCPRGLAASVMAPRVFRHEGLPAGPPWEQVRRLLAGTNGGSPAEVRDHAILLLLAVYGARAGEVAGLRLEDLDWERETITFNRPKQRRTQSYPLSQEVGRALVRYLKEVRPKTACREVFLTLRAPIRPLTSGTLWPVVARRLRPLEPGLKHHGPHALRHACATHLLGRGLSLKEVGDHLGHRSPETTRIYAKVNLPLLREVAAFDLGGLP